MMAAYHGLGGITPTDQEVEAVARAIAAEDGYPEQDGRDDDETWWWMYERHARAAIAALDQVRGK